jgi:photosystem II stability/assembly factor-like uncharacterized protein
LEDFFVIINRRTILIALSIFIFSNSLFGQGPWRSTRCEIDGDLVAVFFTSDKNGWIGGDGGYLASTNDAGKTWTKYSLKSADDINEIYFRNEDNGYIVAGRKMFITSNAGRVWQETNLVKPGEIKNGTPEFLSIRFADKKRGLAIGSIWKKQGKNDVVVDSLVMRSEDGGSTWQRIAVPARGELYHLDYNGTSHAWIVGDHGVVLASTDSGKTWKLQTSGVRLPLYNVDFRDDYEGYAVGKSGVILRTENGGDRWERVLTPFTESLMRVDFADDKNGWIVGYKGTVLRSNNKGRNWVKQDSGASEHLYGLFMNKKIGWAVGENGLLLQQTR